MRAGAHLKPVDAALNGTPGNDLSMQPQIRTIPEFDLFIVKKFLDAKTCRELITEMLGSPVVAAPTYGKGEPSVDERIRRVSQASLSAKTVLDLTQRLEEERPNLQSHFHIELGGIEEPQFLRYRVGDFFVAHQDGNTGMINLESDRTRRVSVTIFLNAQSAELGADGYGGGSLVFSDWRAGTRREIGGESGMLVGFRSETTHEVTPVTHGERFAIVTWYRLSHPQ
jgi:SM-20-related protein